MVATPEQWLIDGIAGKFQRGDLTGARDDCERVLAGAHDARHQATARFWLGAIEAKGGALAAAVEQYERALAVDRRDPMWLLQAGLTYFLLRNVARAEQLYRESLSLRPDYALAHYNLGVLLQHKPDLAGARAAFEAAVAHQPAFPEAHTNLANTLVELGDAARAEAHYHRALALNPRLAHAHYGLGLHHLRGGRLDAASRCFAATLEQDPAHLDAWLDLAECHHQAGRDPQAIACLDRLLALDGSHATARFKRAQFSGAQPAHTPHAVIERLYAGMAGTFDEHVTQRLGYRVPSILVDALTPWLEDFRRRKGRLPRVLDLGCGTGLTGAALRPFAAAMTGVDLSAAMLARARERGHYDELIESDLQSFLLRGEPAAGKTFDLVTATDVLIYVGRVDALFPPIAAQLSSAGVFAFSIESPRQLEAECRLEASGRYVHGVDYIRRLAEESGFDVIQQIATMIRTENTVPLDGYVLILQKR